MPRTFANVIKPTHICNLACTYCYNDDARDPIMRDGTLLRTIEQTFAYARKRKFETIDFIWHGGEPMVPGLGWYRKAMAMQRELADGMHYSNLIQTNGVLINAEWLEFFREHAFEVSISIDGPMALHDAYRKTHQGKGSFERVFAKLNMVKEAGLPLGVCVVLSKATINHVEEILDFFVKNRLPFEVIPVTKSGGARSHYDLLGLDPVEYGEAWVRMYDAWLALGGEDYVMCQDFLFKTRAVIHGHGAHCFGMANCSTDNISTDPVGDIFPCSTLSGTDEVKYGNICEDDLDEIMAAQVAKMFLARPVDPECSTCKWQHVCHGGCVSRSFKFHGDIGKRDYYCPSLYRIHDHIEQRLSERGIGAGAPHVFHMTDGIDPGSCHSGAAPVNTAGSVPKPVPVVS